MNVRHFNIAFITICLIGLLISSASAYTIAILPFEDLTETRSGVDLKLTHHLSETLQNYGIQTIDNRKTIDFMIDNSLRRCGEIDSLTARRMAQALSCDAILLGTIIERSTERIPKIAMTLTLVDGRGGEQIWGTTVCEHINDNQPFLGIGRLTTASEVQQHSLDVAAKTLTADLNQLPTIKAALPDYRITDVQLEPQLVRNGAPLSCRVRIQFLGQTPDYLKVETSAGSSILKRSRIEHCYEGDILTDPRDGNHPIDLYIHWSNNKNEKIKDLATYRVANTPPKLKMHVTTGLNIENTHAFSDSIVIVPHLEDPRPLDRWRLVIKDQNGQTILSEGQNAELPERLEWNGTDSRNHRVETGRYTMTMQVWDVAGNQNRVATKFYLQPTSQEMINVSQVFIDGENFLQLLPAENQIVPIEHWSLTLETEDGSPIYTKTGWELPSFVAIPDDISIENFICNVKALDKLGNNSLLSEAKINLNPSRSKVAQRSRQNQWTADF